jgi:hypothetical protein
MSSFMVSAWLIPERKWSMGTSPITPEHKKDKIRKKRLRRPAPGRQYTWLNQVADPIISHHPEGLSRMRKKVRQRRSRKTLPPHYLGGVHKRDALYSARREPQRLNVLASTLRLFARYGLAGRPFCASCGRC